MDTKTLTTPQDVYDAFDVPTDEGKRTYNTMMSGMVKIKAVADEDHDEAVRLARLFVQGYADDIMAIHSEEAMEIAKADIGYCTGYFSPDMGQFWFSAIECSHPIFGTSYPSPEEAFEAGSGQPSRDDLPAVTDQ